MDHAGTPASKTEQPIYKGLGLPGPDPAWACCLKDDYVLLSKSNLKLAAASATLVLAVMAFAGWNGLMGAAKGKAEEAATAKAAEVSTDTATHVAECTAERVATSTAATVAGRVSEATASAKLRGADSESKIILEEMRARRDELSAMSVP